MDYGRLALRVPAVPKSEHITFRYGSTTFQMAGHPGSHITGYIKQHGYFGPMKEIDALRRTAGIASGIVLDVGANVGVVSLYAAKLGFPVIAVEASELNMKRLQESIGMNNFHNVTALKVAASNAPGCLAMAVGWTKTNNEVNFGMNSFAVKANDGTPVEHVLASRLDALVPPTVHVAFFKLDVEGWECFALEGAKQLFVRKQVDILFMEVNMNMLTKAGCSPAGLKARLSKLCFDVSSFPSAKPGESNDYYGRQKANCQITD